MPYGDSFEKYDENASVSKMSQRPVTFEITARDPHTKARAGILSTPHGVIKTPAFIPVGTKATVKGVTVPQLREIGAQAVLANTYHLYLEPGHERVRAMGGFAKFMGWTGPTFTDSGGFQAFSLGAAFDKGISKLSKADPNKLLPEETESGRGERKSAAKPAKVSEESVTFFSHIDGSRHVFTPKLSMEIQDALAADVIFAFDECTSPTETTSYQRIALDRTHRWARQCLEHHAAIGASERQAMYAVVQGGREQHLREESARVLSEMEVNGRGFDGFGIGGGFEKADMAGAVEWVNSILPEHKPRHLLGIGEPEDVLDGISKGCDTFDCVAATRIGRNGQAYTATGKINVRNAEFRDDTSPVDADCDCSTCTTYSRAYLSHLFRADEMLGPILLSIHNLRFIIRLVDGAREAIEHGNFEEYKSNFRAKYLTNRGIDSFYK